MHTESDANARDALNGGQTFHPPIPPDWRILVTGITSIHGWPVWKALCASARPEQIFGVRPPKMKIPAAANCAAACIADESFFRSVRERFNPTHIIHAAGVCDLDVCEERPHWAHMINVEGAAVLARTFTPSARICYLSTDLVYSGNNPPVVGYNESDAPDPVSVAGKTFAEAEEVIGARPRSCIVRLGLPVGDSVTGDKGAWDWIESRFRRGLPVTLFHDELRSCIACEAIAHTVFRIVRGEYEGLFHYGGLKPVSLYELGLAVLRSGKHPERLLRGISRMQESGGPPRIGNVALNAARLASLLGHDIFPDPAFMSQRASAAAL